MVYKGVSVTLEFCKNEFVSSFFEFIWRVCLVPGEENAEVAHFCTIKVFGDEGEVGGVII